MNLVYLGLQVYRYWKTRPQQETSATVAAATAGAQERLPSHILIKAGNEELQLPLQEVAYFYSEQKVVFAVTRTGRRLITQYTLAELETLLSPGSFFKVSRQTIAHRQSIKSMRKDANYKLLVQLEVKGQPIREETVSRYKAAEFREWFREEVHHSA